MLTILIQDIRSGTTDHQLAEVKVPLRVADDSQDGYWADAKVLNIIYNLYFQRNNSLIVCFRLRRFVRSFNPALRGLMVLSTFHSSIID
jgi:hypothetical protein